MIDDDVIERVYNFLSKTQPQRTFDMVKPLYMDRNTLKFVLSILRRQGRAKRIDKYVSLGNGFGGLRSFWVKQ